MPDPRQPARLRPASHGPRGRASEEGFILITVLFMAALLLIALAVAAPRVAQSIQRDKEIELVHRGQQYRRAIQLYYRKFGRYPTSIDQLLNTNNIRFLRKRYKDPITGKDDWRLIHLGQAKVPPLGFFGQPLAGIPVATNIATPVNGATGKAGGSSVFGGSAFGSSAFGQSGTASAGSPFSNVTQDVPEGDSEDSGSDTGVVGQNAADHPSVTITGANPAPSPGSPGSGSASSGSAAGSSGDSAFGSSGSAFGSSSANGMGAGPIVGVGIPSPKASLLDYKKQTHYNKWEFVYNPIVDKMRQAAGMLGRSGAGSGSVKDSSSPFGDSGNSSSPFKNGNSSGPFGNSGSSSSPFGSSGDNSSPFSNSGSQNGGGTSSPPGSHPQ